MRLSGIQPFTMIDFPEKIACVVFTPGCPFRCGYCHNPEFVLPEKLKEMKRDFIPDKTFFNFLDERRGLLEGVVITGGEPTIMKDLVEFCEKIKEKGYVIKLDTNGINPEVIALLINNRLIDYIAIDVKTSVLQYKSLCGDGAKGEKVAESIKVVMASGIEYEFRSTLIKKIHTQKILEDMAEMVKGAKKLYLQSFRPAITLDPKFSKHKPFSQKEVEGIRDDIFLPKVVHVEIR
jgi:pyruvate formate lyase activating enzyme